MLILFVTEITTILIEKLNKFVGRFEKIYYKQLKNWSNDLPLYDSGLLLSWINEIFR